MKRLITGLLMTILFLLNVSFFGWVVWITYFRPAVHAAQLAKAGYEDEFEEIAFSTRDIKSHFHNIDESISIDKQNPSLCFKCHGTYPHSKAKDVRSFLNFHAFIISCEVCHVRKEPGQEVTYKWIKNGSDEEIKVLRGKPGNYGARLVPFLKEDGAFNRLDRTLNDKTVQNYMKFRDTFTGDQAAEAKLRLHKGISNKPVFCDECHKENGYLDFANLAYPRDRAGQLTSLEVAGMIAKYKEFYLPTMFDPEAIMRDRQSNLDAEQSQKTKKK